MAKKYPNIDRHQKQNPKSQPGQGKPCVCCEVPTTGKIEIQVSYMRGDDEHEPCCDDCWKKYHEQEILDKVIDLWMALI